MGESSWGPAARVGSVFHSSLNGPKCRKLGRGLGVGGGGELPLSCSTLSKPTNHPEALLIGRLLAPPPEGPTQGIWDGAGHLHF